MGNEVSLVDQLEDVITEFGRNLEEKVSNFGETVQVCTVPAVNCSWKADHIREPFSLQVCFSRVRESAVAFNERLAELTLTYAERIAKTDGPTDDSYAVGRFFLFFAILAAWVGIVSGINTPLFMRPFSQTIQRG